MKTFYHGREVSIKSFKIGPVHLKCPKYDRFLDFIPLHVHKCKDVRILHQVLKLTAM